MANPIKATAYYHRGLAKRALGQSDAAIENYDEAIRINSNYAGAYYHRGLAMHALGAYKSAIADFDKAKSLRYG